jgi:hypothetical protein
MSIDGPRGQPDDGKDNPDRPPHDRHASEPADHRTSAPDLAETRSRQEYYNVLVADASRRSPARSSLPWRQQAAGEPCTSTTCKRSWTPTTPHKDIYEHAHLLRSDSDGLFCPQMIERWHRLCPASIHPVYS